VISWIVLVQAERKHETNLGNHLCPRPRWFRLIRRYAVTREMSIARPLQVPLAPERSEKISVISEQAFIIAIRCYKYIAPAEL
jgi:hypothetical protein